MLTTAPNFSNIGNRVPAHILRHQTFDIGAGFVGKDKQTSPPEKPPCCWEALQVDYHVRITLDIQVIFTYIK